MSVPVVVVVKVIRSVKPPKLVNVIVDIPVTPGATSSEAGLAVIAKSVWLEKFPLTRVSESGTPVPLPIVTWMRLMGVPGESDKVLYVIVNNSPVPPTSPPVFAAASSTTPTVSSAGLQEDPVMSAPSMHFARIVAEEPRTDPVRSASIAESTVWSALT